MKKLDDETLECWLHEDCTCTPSPTALQQRLDEARAKIEDLQGDLNNEVISHMRTKKRLDATRAKLAAVEALCAEMEQGVRRVEAKGLDGFAGAMDKMIAADLRTALTTGDAA